MWKHNDASLLVSEKFTFKLYVLVRPLRQSELYHRLLENLLAFLLLYLVHLQAQYMKSC